MYIDWPICGSSVSLLPHPLRAPGLGCCGGACNRGLGYFDSGWDLSGWGVVEWLTVAAGAYVLFSVLSTTKRGVGRARRGYQHLRAAPGRRARARAGVTGGGGRMRRGGAFESA